MLDSQNHLEAVGHLKLATGKSPAVIHPSCEAAAASASVLQLSGSGSSQVYIFMWRTHSHHDLDL